MPNLRKYTPPVDQLLRLGSDPEAEEEGYDYLKLGFSEKHIPQLIELATDYDLLFPEEDKYEEDDPLLYGPIHAWRALGQMQAAEAVEPLLGLLAQEDDYIEEEIPTILAMIGEPSIEPLREYIEENVDMELGTDLAIDCLQEIGVLNPDLTDKCVAVLMDFLTNFEENDEAFNAMLINALGELHADVAMPLIEEAYDAGAVDEAIIDRDQVDLLMNRMPLEKQREMMDSLRGVFPPELMEILQQPEAQEELRKISRQLKRDMLRGDLDVENDEIDEQSILNFLDSDLDEGEEDFKPQNNGKKPNQNKPKKKK